MKYFEEILRQITERLSSLSKWFFIFVAISCLTSLSLAQDEEAEEDEEDNEEEMELVVVTGSRVAQNYGEVAGQVVVMDEAAIRATGEQTLERVLRQLPQNLNPTTERYGSDLNNVTNFTGGSTVNLRGLGSESTLILVDGKRIGHNGILGGVTDISSIPLNQVERIEIVLDGASAIYGSDAVGGVVNVISKKDFQGIELTADYNSPSTAGYDETRVGVSISQQFRAMNFRASFQKSEHNGLDASDREVTIFQRSLFPGPELDVRFCCLSDGTALPIAYSIEDWLGRAIFYTVPAFNELPDETKADATAYTHAILPRRFDENSTLADINSWRKPIWGEETQEGYTILPDTSRNSMLFGVFWELDENWSVETQLRQETRTVLNNQGFIAFTGETLHAGNPFNPFDRSIHLRGQRRDLPQPHTETEGVQVNFNIEVIGRVSDTLEVEASIGQSTEEADTFRHFNLDRSALRAAMNSDGETPSTQFLFGESEASCLALGGTFGFGLCRVPVPPPAPANPFGDISRFISERPLEATSFNRLFRIEGLLRTKLFDVPAGSARAIIGLSRQTLVLESASEFQIGAVDQSPVSDISQFHTEAERTNTAIFAEGIMPLISSINEQVWAQRLTMSLSLRNDTYDEPAVVYINPIEGDSRPSGLPDPGSQNTWGLGFVWVPMEMVEVKYNLQTAFVAPQLNQLLRESSMGPSPPFRGIFLQLPNGNLQQVGVTIVEGGNPDLLSETADTQSFGVAFSPDLIPNLRVGATFNDVQYNNRINRLSNFIVDPNNLPSNITYIPETDEYIQERRWINVSSVDRQGVDFTLRWTPNTKWGDLSVDIKHSVINSYDYVIDPDDPESDEVISVVGETDGSTAIGVVSKNSSNLTIGWYHKGLELGVDVATRSSTKAVLTGVTREYSPPTLTDFRLTMHLISGSFFDVPEYLKDGRISLVCTNFFNEYGETTLTNNDGEVLEPNGPDASPLYGRMVNLSLYLPL